MRFLLPVLLLLSACATTDEKKPKYTITFHAQASDMDPPKTMFPFDLNGRRIFFKVVPEFSQQNIIAFHPFPSDSGNGSGAVLQLDFRGKAELEIITRTRKDECLLAMVNAKPVDYVVLDGPVTDGMITIWQGIPDEVVKKMDKHVPRMRKGNTPTSSDRIDMLPTTPGEKIRAFDSAAAEQKAIKDGVPLKKIPSLDLPPTPSAPVTPKIPVEGENSPPPPSPSSPVPPPLPPLPPSPFPRTPVSGEQPSLPKP